jgi:hypothetical protein
MENVMSSAESGLEPEDKIELRHAADVVQPADSESKEGPNTRTASQAESLLAAETRTLQMIADGESLKDILNDLCCSIDVQASPVISTVLLMDPDGERLWHTAGNRVPRDWLPVVSPLPISPHAGCCGAAALSKERVIVADVATDINWRICVSQRDGEQTRTDMDNQLSFFSKFTEMKPSSVPALLRPKADKVLRRSLPNKVR